MMTQADKPSGYHTDGTTEEKIRALMAHSLPPTEPLRTYVMRLLPSNGPKWSTEETDRRDPAAEVRDYEGLIAFHYFDSEHQAGVRTNVSGLYYVDAVRVESRELVICRDGRRRRFDPDTDHIITSGGEIIVSPGREET